MFELARRYVRTSLVFAVLGVFLGVYMIAQRFSDSPKPLRWLPTAHSHLFLVVFVTTMIMGVAIWMFPHPKGRSLFAIGFGNLLLAHNPWNGSEDNWRSCSKSLNR